MTIYHHRKTLWRKYKFTWLEWSITKSAIKCTIHSSYSKISLCELWIRMNSLFWTTVYKIISIYDTLDNIRVACWDLVIQTILSRALSHRTRNPASVDNTEGDSDWQSISVEGIYHHLSKYKLHTHFGLAVLGS